MSSLRKKSSNKDTLPAEDVDIESPQGKGSPPTESFSAPSGHNPIILAKIIFRKVISHLTSDEEDGTANESFGFGIISVLRDVALGSIMGVIAISIIIFLDHRDVVHLQSAHNFRAAAFHLLNDPETLANVEKSSGALGSIMGVIAISIFIFLDHRDVVHLQGAHDFRAAAFQLLKDPETLANVEKSSGLKFMIMTDYESTRKEIDRLVEQKVDNDKKVKEQSEAEARQKELVEAQQKEVATMAEEYGVLMMHPLIRLDNFCGSCSWAGKVTCDRRAAQMKEKHHMGAIAAKLSVMEGKACKKQ
eukprot:CAMPEP_0172575706 /NCGR_PEP_ID=MMETSP1067-20121228/137348_1 /TAXON_ID=265564 ORGANISM="Thalassiosira punctigera, Strain Tpunct2005C2" /NCGR_SAMPLE_ID=MMETSP1067 /ASSEMBLY_ACC=CAM_ASM_000444 /LENGTH=303 /DNA_ID=CAMNT_0013368357 /DNA_START=115 /DNA_END=1026 /DNA_ORIENTATION=-